MLTKPLNEHKLWKGKLACAGPSKLPSTFVCSPFGTEYIFQNGQIGNYKTISDSYWSGVKLRNKMYRDKMRSQPDLQ